MAQRDANGRIVGAGGGAATLDELTDVSTAGADANDVLAVNGTSWTPTAPGGGASPTTTAGDLIVRGASADERLPIGSAGQVLTVVSGQPAWAAAPAGEGGGATAASYAKVSRTTNQSITSSDLTTAVSFDTEDADTDGYWDAGSPTIFTIPEDGFYIVTAQAYWAASSVFSHIGLFLALNGDMSAASRRVATQYWQQPSGTSNPRQNVTFAGKLSAGDTIQLHAYQNSGSARSIDASEPIWMSICRVSGAAPSGGGAMSYVGGAEVTGSAATELEVTGLDLNADELYFIEFKIQSAAGTNPMVALYYNSDTTAANYYNQAQASDGGSTYSGRSNNGTLVQLLTGTDSVGWGRLYSEIDGNPVMHVSFTQGEFAAQRVFEAAHTWNSTANVTSFKLVHPNAGGLAVGTRIRVWKLLEVTSVPSGGGSGSYVLRQLDAALSRSNDATFADIPELSVTLTAGRRYALRFRAYVYNGVGDSSTQLTFTGTESDVTLHQVVTLSGTNYPALKTALDNGAALTNTGWHWVQFEGFMHADTAGDLKAQFKQVTSNADASIVAAGAFLEVMSPA